MVSRLEKSLSPITSATVVIFAELNLVPRVLSYPPYERERAGRREPWERGCALLGFAVCFTVCHLLIVFFSVTVGDETPIFMLLTLRRRVGRYRHV